MTGMVELDDLLTNEQTAAILGIKPKTLEIWRIKGRSPPFLKFGATKQSPVRYQRTAVLRWLTQQSFASTSAYAGSRNRVAVKRPSEPPRFVESLTYREGRDD
jgi:hypothetical protein